MRVDSCAETGSALVVYEAATVLAAALKEASIASVVKVDDKTFHLLGSLNAEPYAAEMRGQIVT